VGGFRLQLVTARQHQNSLQAILIPLFVAVHIALHLSPKLIFYGHSNVHLTLRLFVCLMDAAGIQLDCLMPSKVSLGIILNAFM